MSGVLFAALAACSSEGDALPDAGADVDAEVDACVPGWTRELVGEGGWNDALAVDAAGVPHVTFQGTDYRQKYAQRVDGVWLQETVEPDFRAAWISAIALDPAGLPHVSYFDFEASALWHAQRTADGDWERTRVDPDAHWAVAMTIVADGVIHLAYLSTGNQLRYASSSDGRSWAPVSIGGFDNSYAVAIAADSAGVHIVSDGNDIPYAHLPAGGEWEVGTVNEAGGDGASVVIDADGVPHIGYHQYGDFQLVHSYRTSDGWVTETVVDDGRARDPKLAIDPAGGLELAYALLEPTIAHARRGPDGVWTTDTVMSEPATFRDLSFAIDATGRRQLTIFESFDEQLMYATACE